jgi:hypothetical protein
MIAVRYVYITFSFFSIATSSRDDLHRRIGGRCSSHNMKVVFKVCCKAEDLDKGETIISFFPAKENDDLTQYVFFFFFFFL